MLGELALEDAILRIEIRGLDGTVLASSAMETNGQPYADSEEMTLASGGSARASLVDAAATPEAVGGLAESVTVVQEYLPILDADGETLAVVGVWRDASELLASIESVRSDITLVILVAGLLLAVVLFFVFRAAQARLSRQHGQLLDATRRDSLTGMLNHGSIVATLTEAVERARRTGHHITVALVDIDGFRLFNDTHGHDAADEVLLRVAELVTSEGGGSRHVARYGPDEFLLVHEGGSIADIEASVENLRAGLRDLSVQFGESERLPVTVSVGICAYPDHGSSVTDLLAAAVVAVGEAKASGGDAVRLPRTEEEEEQQAVSASFDVLQGLVIAVDTKDRYTKRHSEDVARYAVFLASRLGLDEDIQRTIRISGLLHDVGKIGIPDVLLRKPSKLSDEEYGIFQQHVALGDSIVRDVPNLELVRAGIRYHHERWDGGGYLAGLEGEEIPFLGRILAVADAFSAMTTSRPYRKALSVTEAIKRLEDAAGTQLQEDLVAAFVTGIETAADAPLPGQDSATLWRPELWVA
jgi:diguanylate cyclase (GGDEF)-like protein